MDSFYAGWFSLIPPIFAITLALLTKEVIFSLFLGVLSGTLIYSLGMGLNPISGTVGTAFDLVIKSADLNIIIFVCLLGALVSVISLSGGSKAYGKWASSKIKNGRLSLAAAGYYDNGFQVFLSTIPLNLYAILSLAMVFTIVFTGKDYGPMAASEHSARCRMPDAEKDSVRPADRPRQGTVADMLVPILALILFAVTAMLYTGGFFTAGDTFLDIGAAFGSSETSKSLVWASFGAILTAMVMFVPRKLMDFNEFMNGISNGFQTMVPACSILFLAWTIGSVCRDLLQTPAFVSDLLAGSHIPMFLLPAMIFVIAAFLSFSTGTAWGTFGILIPIIAPAAHALAPELLTVSLSATLAGSVLGDNCSPISDTTILSSAGAGCGHIEHVETQLPYALTVAVCCIAGYLVSGISGANVLLTLGVSGGLLILCIFTAHAFYAKRAGASPK